MRLFFLVFIMACSSGQKQNKKSAWETWNGRPATDIANHPYFKSLPLSKLKHPDGVETWMYKEQARFQTDAYCQSVGGCIAIPSYNCNNAFSVENGLIVGMEQTGVCPDPKVIRYKE